MLSYFYENLLKAIKMQYLFSYNIISYELKKSWYI